MPFMKSIRFNTTDARDREFVATLRKNVSDYFKENNISQKANGAMWFKAIALIAIYVVPFVLILTIPMNAWWAFFWCIIMGIGIAGVGMGIMHDATHGAFSKKQWVNDLFAGTLYLLGSNILNWKIQHNVLHHTYTNISGMDEDIADKGPLRLSENRPLKKYHKFQQYYAFIFYGMMTLVMLTNDFIRLSGYAKADLLKAQNKELAPEFLKMFIRKILYLTVIFGLPLWLTDFSFWQILGGFLMMHWVASIILSFVFQMAHVVEGAEQFSEAPMMSNEWHVHQLHTTSDFARNSPILSWYVGGLNYQIEHHLFPSICHVHYKQLAPIVQRTAEMYGIPYNLKPGFGAALISHFKQLKRLGEVPIVQ
jgi:linoleoyl-CoA desaturase